MSRKNKRLLIEKIEILDIAEKGKSVAKHETRVIFIDGGIPGDICDIIVYKRNRKFWQARIQKIHQYSDHREVPKCEHFGTCGGCKWQNMKYLSQVNYKEDKVINNLKKISESILPKHNKIIASKNEYFYRNKMEFTFSNRRWLSTEEIKSDEDIKDRNALGFHIPGRFDKVININKCYLQKDPSNKIRISIKEFADKHKLTYFDIQENNGLLRNLMIRTSSTNEVMVLIQFYEDNIEDISLLMDHIKQSFPEVTSLLYVINRKVNNTIYDQEVICYHGRGYIREEIDGLSFNIGPKTFFQTNSDQVKILYSKTKKLSNIKKSDIVYDLYTGTGTIAQYIAKDANKVIGIDSVEEAIQAAYKNARRNGIKNCFFYTGDMKDIFTNTFIQDNGSPDIIITDPPREGMHKKVVEQICKIGAKKIVYVSCNSSTQARDISIMKDIYHITHIQPIDMFPQTHHVENIVVLERK